MGNKNKKRAEEGMADLGPRVTSQNENLWGRANNAFDTNLSDYGNLMGNYQDFIKTGGYSSDDLANIRARSIEPTRAIYANMERELDRNRALQGGYSPNYAAASAKMGRESSQQISDIGRATEADIADRVQRGKLAGLSGATNLYGTTPGLASTFGNMALNSTGQMINTQALRNDLAKGGGGWMNTLSGLAGLGGNLLDVFKKLPFGPGKGNNPDDKKKAGSVPGGGGSGMVPDYLTGYDPNFQVDPPPLAGNQIPNSPTGPPSIPQGGGDVTTDYQVNQIPIMKPSGEQGSAIQVPGSVPPLFMDEDYNIYDQTGAYMGNYMTGEGAGG